MSADRKKGKIIHSGERQIIRNVIECCDKEAKDKCLSVPLAKATERAALYCNISVCTVKNIRKQSKTHPEEKLSTPGKSRKKPEHLKANIDSFDRAVILNTIKDFYINQKTVPTIKKLLPVLKEKIDFRWSSWVLRKVLKDMGFCWKRCKSKRTVLMERPDIVNWRCNFLRSMKKLRSEKRKIYYLDETWVDANLTFGKCWQNSEVTGIRTNTSSSNRLIIVHVGSEEGFLQGSELVFKAGTTKGDYHGQMNSENFEKWLTEKVLPNLTPNSVLVMDNAPYHTKEFDKPPTKSALKQTMLDWLSKHGKVMDPTTRKADLITEIELLKPKEKIFTADKLIKSHGHEVLRLPPYMCDINPIEYAWAQMKNYVRSKNVVGDMSLKRLQELVNESINNVTKENWTNFVTHVQSIEADYWRSDSVVEDAIDQFVIQLGGGQDSDSDNNNSENDDGEISEDSFCDLAAPLDNY